MSTPQLKKVVHLTTVHHPYDPRIYHKECKSLQDAGFDVTLIAQEAEMKAKMGTQQAKQNSKTAQQQVSSSKSAQQAGDLATQSSESNQKVDRENRPHVPRHIPLKRYGSRIRRMVFGGLDLYRKAKEEEADVYHFHDPELLPVAWLLKKKDNVVIYDIHEDYVTSIMQKDYLSYPVKKMVAAAYKLMEKFFARDFELCLAEKYYKEMYPDGTCILNYPTVNEKFLNHTRDNEPIEDKLLYTGNVSDVRGAKIHAKIPLIDDQIAVHFVGKCPGDLAEEMREIAGNKQDHLHFEGIDRFVEKEVIEDRYLGTNWLAGIALFPPTDHYMKKELTKFFEYMNAGLPIICSDFPVWKKFVEKHECGIAVDPYDENEIKQAIQYLGNNPDAARKMGENGKKAVTLELNWHTEEQKLIAWYNELLGQPNTEPVQKGMTE